MVINSPATLTLDSDNLGIVEFYLIGFSLFYDSQCKKRYKERRKRYLPPICSPLSLFPITLHSPKRETERGGGRERERERERVRRGRL